MSSDFNRRLVLAIVLPSMVLAGCSSPQPAEPTRMLQIQQQWQLQPGDTIVGHRVLGGLGDISIELKGNSAYAPTDGEIQPNVPGCVIFSSAEIPAYVFRLCGLEQPRLGKVQQGAAIGSGDYLQFAALRRQPDGTWAMVEPSTSILEQTLKKP